MVLLSNINISVPCNEHSNESDDASMKNGSHSSQKREIEESADNDPTMTSDRKGKGDGSGHKEEGSGGDSSMIAPCKVIKKCAVAFDKETKLPITCEDQEMLKDDDSKYLSLLPVIPSIFG